MDEASLKTILSGESRGVKPALARGMLACAAIPYGFGVRLRNALFDVGLRKPHRAGVPVVSVGNITAGGTGKTPFVAHVVRLLQEWGMRPAILSRGYRSLDGQANDEKLVLDRLCPGVPHIQNRDRIAGARVAIDEHRANVLVLDDGFQHRRLARDLDIVLVDASNPWGYGRLLPRGLLREPLRGLRRADLFVITRADQATEDAKRGIVETIRRAGATAPVIEAAFKPTTLVSHGAAPRPISALRGAHVVAFCGIGNPLAFRRTLESAGARIEYLIAFPDHHHYQPADLATIVAITRAARVTVAAGALSSRLPPMSAVTTEKDLVKLPAGEIEGVPIVAVRIETQILGVDSPLRDSLRSIAATESSRVTPPP